nr:ulp1 protease family, C-terminal catalytic domain-containing protein [Tanacetum cinerariifolium]
MVSDNNPFKRRKETAAMTEHVTAQLSQVTKGDDLEVICISPSTQTSMEVESGTQNALLKNIRGWEGAHSVMYSLKARQMLGANKVFFALMKFSKTSYHYYPIRFNMKAVEIDIIDNIDNDIEHVKGAKVYKEAKEYAKKKTKTLKFFTDNIVKVVQDLYQKLIDNYIELN